MEKTASSYAIFCESIERYDLVVGHYLDNPNCQLLGTFADFELLCIALKALIERDRFALRTIKPAGQQPSSHPQSLTFYQRMLSVRVESNIKRFLHFLEMISNSCTLFEEKYFAADTAKLKGDLLRYLAELCSPAEILERAEMAEKAYREAMIILDASDTEGEKCSARKLALSLNWAILKFELKGETRQAVRDAEAVAENFLSAQGSMIEERLKEAVPVYRLLEENLKQWRKQLEEEEIHG